MTCEINEHFEYIFNNSPRFYYLSCKKITKGTSHCQKIFIYLYFNANFQSADTIIYNMLLIFEL